MSKLKSNEAYEKTVPFVSSAGSQVRKTLILITLR